MWMLIAQAVVLAVVVPLCLVAWVCLRAWLGEYRQVRDAAVRARANTGPDDKPYPPTDQGMCDHCRQSFEKVHFMPSGERACRVCYDRLVAPGVSSGPPPQET